MSKKYKRQYRKPQQGRKALGEPSPVVTIEKCVFGGDGLARHDGRTYFVSRALPGEKVQLGPVYKKKQVYLSSVQEIIEASPYRREAPCSYYDECGGCNWQHVEYEHQLELKLSMVKESLNHVFGEDCIPEIELISGEEWYYRHRAQLKVRDGEIGFFANKSHDVVDILHCRVLCKELNVFMNEARDYDLSHIKEIKVIAGSHGKVASYPILQESTVMIDEMDVNGKKIEVTGMSFFQQNRELTPKLGDWVRKRVKGGNVIDLFGGSGFFSLMVHDSVKEVVLVELEESLTRLAEKNVLNNKAENIEVVCSSVDNFFSSEHFKDLSHDVTVIVDPPRGGLSRSTVEVLSNTPMEQLIYVACDPNTQVRDVKLLKEQGGFEIKECALFDLYPNTHHMETVLVLQRK